MQKYKIKIATYIVVEAKDKKEAIKKGLDSAGWRDFTEYRKEDVISVKKVK